MVDTGGMTPQDTKSSEVPLSRHRGAPNRKRRISCVPKGFCSSTSQDKQNKARAARQTKQNKSKTERRGQLQASSGLSPGRASSPEHHAHFGRHSTIRSACKAGWYPPSDGGFRCGHTNPVILNVLSHKLPGHLKFAQPQTYGCERLPKGV